MPTPRRPDADAMLARATAEADAARRGSLEVFFGAAPGVGKTFAMLREGQRQLAAGIDVVVGIAETHGRAETEALLQGLPQLPRRTVQHQGVTLGEFDLDAALQRAPRLLLLDELAHTNAPGSRHQKRWQDVRELLDAGIDVATTLNVQHVESLVDVIAQLTGVRVRETVPDDLLEHATEVHLVDLPPDDLLARLRDGKVYRPAMAQDALANFFGKGNLIALRELALRWTAERVDAQMGDWRRAQGIAQPLPAGDTVLCCVSSAPQSEALVRAARRMAEALRARWFAVTVDTPGARELPAADRARLDQHLRLCERLGGTPIVLSGEDVATEVLAFARRENVTRLVCGKPVPRRFGRWRRNAILDDLVAGSAGIDVLLPHVQVTAIASEPAAPRPSSPWQGRAHAEAVLVVGAGTAMALAAGELFTPTDLAMGSLLGIVWIAVRHGRSPAVFAAALTILAFDFCFVPPLWSFAVADQRYLLTFVVMLGTGLVTSTLAGRLRHQLQDGRARTLRLQRLQALAVDLAVAADANAIAEVVVRHASVAAGTGAAWLGRRGGPVEVIAHAGEPHPDSEKELGVATWALDFERRAGATTGTLDEAAFVYLPLRGAEQTVAVLALPRPATVTFAAEALQVVEQMGHQGALAVERLHLIDAARRAELEADTERLRSSLLESVSHDLRTPLAAIAGASSALLDDAHPIDAATRRDLASTIQEEALRLSRFVANLLDMTRLQAGALALHAEWHSVEELVGSSLAAARAALRDRSVGTDLAPGLPLVSMDETLIRQVLVNLLDNAAKYSPANAKVTLRATQADGDLLVEVLDRGPGFAVEESERVFDKFYRGRGGGTGVGLGLTIARGIVLAHGGRIGVGNRDGGGARVWFTLPLGTPPALPDEDAATATESAP